MKSISIQVFGRVQGVWFRASTRQKALELGLKGIVQNQQDGSLYIEVLGNENDLTEFIEWCKEGPVHARVSHIELNELPGRQFEDFEIVR